MLNNLQDAKSSLQRSKHKIEAAILVGTAQLDSLNAHRHHAVESRAAAERRHFKLKELTESLCDQCWELFPAIDRSNLHRPRAFANGNNGQCINCGLSDHLTKNVGLVEYPPQNTNSLNEAQSACKVARSAIFGEPQWPVGANFSFPYGHEHENLWAYTIPHGQSFDVPPMWQYRRADPLPHHNEESSTPSPSHDAKESKRALLGVAEKQKNEANKQVETIEDCIKNWTAYVDQHKLQLQQTNSALAAVEKKEQSVSEEERERAVLEQRLRQLNNGRSSSSHATPDHSCPICWNRAKEIGTHRAKNQTSLNVGIT
eukprot:scaffold795_cov94-Skeletonema_dohrnii-CCMP3373.AAC.10